SATTDTMGAGALDVYHMANLCNAIRHDEKLRSPMHEAAPTSTLCHLGNYAQKVGRTLRINKENGHILDDSEAMQLWSRVYEPGWEPRV
ncbi:MAG: gfo/Idh/MocA family oxidoreductase, partial [Bacteroidota bacterium]